MEFSPDLVFISAGFDAAAGDQLGACLVSPVGYAHMTHMLCGLANGRVVVALEVRQHSNVVTPVLNRSQGGYNLESISNSALAVAQTLLGDALPELPPIVPSVSGMETVWQVALEQSKYWECMGLAPFVPRQSG